MPVHLIDVSAVPPQPWRNGGGQTRELLTWPSTGPWQLRISRADIDADGPFSAFIGVTRWFAVLQGAGVALAFPATRCELRSGDEALCFDGAQPPDCRLLDGSTQDLNLMACGGDSFMSRVVHGSDWDTSCRMRGLYTTMAGDWRGGQERLAIPAHTLLWEDAATPGAWSFGTHANATGQAFWLGFTPEK